MNALEILNMEHEKVRRTFADISDDSHRESTKRKMFESLCEELIRHEMMEHDIWYPHFKNDQRLTDTVKHLLTEEKYAEKAIKQFDNINTFEEWEEKFETFKQKMNQHAYEEEKQLFPQVKKILSDNELEEIGREMSEFKKEYNFGEKH